MIRILLVDYERDCVTALAQRLTFAFRDRHVVADKATVASDALLLARQYAYAVLIVQLPMPGTVGRTLIQQLRSLRPDAHLIVTRCCDANGSRDEDDGATTRGIVASLLKPLDFTALRNIIESLLPVRPSIAAT
jgi:DNA-binding NarL/FixJ family response regulator